MNVIKSRICIDKWSIREQLCLALAVVRNGDQNWVSVSQAIKHLAEPNRPPGWFSQKNCAVQYQLLFQETRISESVDETPLKSVLRRLTEERKMEIRNKMEEEKSEYLKRREILKKKEAIAHAEWLKQREKLKLEVEQELAELESLLEIPAPAPNVTSPILYAALTQRGRPTSSTTASFLKTTASAPVLSSSQQLVNTANSQDSTPAPVASVPPLVSLAQTNTTILAPTTNVYNSPTQENEYIKKPAEKSLLESSKMYKKNTQVNEPEEILESKKVKFGDVIPVEEVTFPVTTEEVEAKHATPSDSIHNSPPSETVILDDERKYHSWKKSVMRIYNRLVTNKYAFLFLKPITDCQAPGYRSIVHQPMDLQTIRKNIENGVTRTTQKFYRDVLLMFLNALMYNKRNGAVYKMTYQMLTESLLEIEILMAAEEQDEAPVRPKPRTSESGFKRTHKEFLTKNKKRRDE